MEKEMNKKSFYSIVILLVMAGMLAGCVPGRAGSGSKVAESKLPRQEISELPFDEAANLAENNNRFAFDLYQALQDQSGNLFFSPYSISAALAMTYAGAEGRTAEEMAQTLYFPLDQGDLHSSFNALDQYLAALAEGEDPNEAGDPFQLRIANALWGQEDFLFNQEFLDILAQNYGAGLRLLDYIEDPETSRLAINQWVSDQTEQRIKDLIPQGAINKSTRLVLSNAIYFNAAWQEQFEESLTEQKPFFGLDGEVMVDMMQTGSDAFFPYYQGDGYQLVELAYAGGSASMLVILPDQGEFENFEFDFGPEELAPALDELVYTPIQLGFPKFEIESEFNLSQTLATMGMPTAFSDQADFSGMTQQEQLAISDIFHKAFVKVDEQGTEAAAATAVVMKVTSAGPEPLVLTVDRPFLYLIREVETGSILFMGRVVSP